MTELPWMVEARRRIGATSLQGPTLLGTLPMWWRRIKRGVVRASEPAWSAAFVSACLEGVGILSTRFEGAGSYLTWGQYLYEPFYGCVAVLKRAAGGHVGFVVGETPDDQLLVLGGIPGVEVTVRAFPKGFVAGYRWPPGELGAPFAMPVLDADRALAALGSPRPERQ